MKIFNFVSVTVFVAVVGGIAYKLTTASSEYYATVHPELCTITAKTYIAGNVYPIKEIELKSNISGILEKVHVSIGENVEDKQVVATIKMMPNSTEIENLRSNVAMAQIAYETVKQEFERVQILYNKEFVAKSEYEKAEKEYRQTEEQYRKAQNLYNITSRGYTDASSASNVVKSSTKGVVIDIPFDEGASVIERNNYNQGTTIAVLAEMNRFVFRAQVAEQYLKHISIGTSMLLLFNAYDSLQIEAKVSKISAKGVSVNGVIRYTIEAEFVVTDDMPIMRSGYSATAEIVLNKRDSVVSIEERYIRFSGDTAFVNTKDTNTNKPYRVYVDVGLSDGVFCEITNGLNIQDNVIIKDIDTEK